MSSEIRNNHDRSGENLAADSLTEETERDLLIALSQIHYDHQVLLDYLISKDTGSSCAEYLLRSLRIVCNSWSLFIEFPGVEEGLDQLRPKRQRVLVDSMDFEDGRISSLEQCNEGHAHGRKGRRNYRLPFVAARDCLVLLRTSINSLNQKNLFPYNPQVLLRRLTSFEELCSAVGALMDLPPGEKVILVGHSIGGVCISLAMEKFPKKIAVAVYVTAFMPGPDLPFTIILEEINHINL
ncbi:UNVERIFIED_CONTAM: Methylesterase 1 [Sesamum radiatum]|uniref:Methylesterase 1 n=1 Tax=Sesamum radiatum TaxID=300843 RepID=A0AAW2REK9_SESRA